MTRSLLLPALSLGLLATPAAPGPHHPAPPPACPSEPAGLVVPDGFCAILVGEGLGRVRHLVVAANGDLFAARAGRDGGVLALRDTDGDGKADVTKSFGPGDGGTGIALGGGYLYFATDTRVLRWPWAPGQLEPSGAPETIVTGLPNDGNHVSKSIALGTDNALYVSVGSATNSCQIWDRRARSAGVDPCGELRTRAGIWRFAADRRDQRQQDGTRYATGLRNAVGLRFDSVTGAVYAATHGRDQLGDNWGYSAEQNAELPAEEFVQVAEGDDFGWPYCYFDQQLGKKVLAPEYGGDGTQIGRCGEKKRPLIGFPGHWAPMDVVLYRGSQFPESYQGGAFLAFHGSWNRAPLPQAGYRIVFAPFASGVPSGRYDTFASGAGGPTELRASGLAVGPDGSLYIAADGNGKIWRVVVRR